MRGHAEIRASHESGFIHRVPIKGTGSVRIVRDSVDRPKAVDYRQLPLAMRTGAGLPFVAGDRLGGVQNDALEQLSQRLIVEVRQALQDFDEVLLDAKTELDAVGTSCFYGTMLSRSHDLSNDLECGRLGPRAARPCRREGFARPCRPGGAAEHTGMLSSTPSRCSQLAAIGCCATTPR